MEKPKKLYEVTLNPLVIEVPLDVSKSEITDYIKAVLKYSGNDLVIKNFKEIRIANDGN